MFETMKKLERDIRKQAPVMLTKVNPLLLLRTHLECFGLLPQLFFYLEI